MKRENVLKNQPETNFRYLVFFGNKDQKLSW